MRRADAGFGAGLAETLMEIVRTRDLVLTMVLAVVFYAFYYPAPYQHQTALKLPMIVVDEEGTPATRALAQALNATREVAVVGTVGDYRAAVQGVKERHADGIVLLPKGGRGYITYPSERRDLESLQLWVDALTGKH